jgi:hypothetical protein
MKTEIEKILEPAYREASPALTYTHTSQREFEENWWNDIRFFAHGEFANKDNADCVTNESTLKLVSDKNRHLEKIGDILIARYEEYFRETEMKDKALCGELPFEWKTDFDYPRFGGWLLNQQKNTYERNILVVIPGKNRKQAVVMADHYDTAYMQDVHDENGGARIAAAGADDNFSATSTLLQSAKIFLNLSKQGKLERDIWLLHLTGEEFPADCMGARNFCENMINQSLVLKNGTKKTDLSNVEIKAVYVLDMIGHNKETDRDVFQISVGKSESSLKAAYFAHHATLKWNLFIDEENRTGDRKGLERGKRVSDINSIPDKAKFLKPEGDVRNYLDPHSSLFNTDGMIFSDIGAPVVLFMENYDISRKGYHDKFDTLENIDLDYGSAIAAIAIETVAMAATD